MDFLLNLIAPVLPLKCPTVSIRPKGCSTSTIGCDNHSIDELERKLNLPGRAGRFGDHSEAGTRHCVRWQPHVYDVENVEELTAELKIHSFCTGRPSTERSVFDRCKIEVVIGGAAKCVTTHCPEPSGGRAEKGISVVGAHTEVVFSIFSGSGEVWLGNLVGAICPHCAKVCLLGSRVDRERST